MAIIADLAQSFSVDSSAVKQSDYAFLTSVVLYFRGKPAPSTTSTNLPKPGVTVYICETKDQNNTQEPVLSDYVKYGRSRVEWKDVVVSTQPANNPNPYSSNGSASFSSGGQVGLDQGGKGTFFKFTSPVPIKTNRFYSIVVKFDGGDTGFQLFKNKSNEQYNTGVAAAVSAGAMSGKLFVLTNGTITTPLNDTDLMMRVNIAKFTANTKTYKAVNRNYELLYYDATSLVGNFKGGEPVYINVGDPAGQTVSTNSLSANLVGTNTVFTTTFAPNDLIVLRSSNNYNVRAIKSIANNTFMTLEEPPAFSNTTAAYQDTVIAKVFHHYPSANQLALIASSANATAYFAPSSNVVGVESGARVSVGGLHNFRINSFQADYISFLPSGTEVTGFIEFAGASNTFNSKQFPIAFNEKVPFSDFEAYIYSRSNEAQNSGTLTRGKSVNVDLTLSTVNEYTSPVINEEYLKFDAWRFICNGNTVNEHLPNKGAAQAKFISKRVTLAEGQDSEDVKVFVTAHRPQGTDIKAYVKFFNPLDTEGMEIKNWTELESRAPDNLISNPNNRKDYVDLQYSLPSYPINDFTNPALPASNTTAIPTTFTLATSNTGIFQRDNTSITVSSSISVGQVLRIFDKVSPNNSIISVVTASNNSTFTVEQVVDQSNSVFSNFRGGGKLVEVCARPNSAYKNFINGGVIRYHNGRFAAFDTYKSFAVKLVFISESKTSFPTVDDLRVICTTV